MQKMQLVAEVSKTFSINRNDCLKLTVQSMKDALKAGDASLLKQGNGEAPTVAKGGNLAEALGAFGSIIEATVDQKLAGFKGGASLEEVTDLVNTVLANRTTEIILRPLTGDPVNVGAAHRRFAEVATYLGMGKDVWVYGPAGSGKTEAALRFVEATKMPFAVVSCHRDLSPGRVIGTTNVVNGEWIDGSIYNILRADGEGGLVILDEIDRAMPGFPVALNLIKSQKMFLRDGKMEKLHPKAIFFVTSNTLFGATNDYTAANKQDQSFINRFKVVQWDYDFEFEKELARPYGTVGMQWCEFVQSVRKKADELGITSGRVSPRQIISGAQDLSAEPKPLPREWVENSEIWERFSPTDRAKLKAAMGR